MSNPSVPLHSFGTPSPEVAPACPPQAGVNGVIVGDLAYIQADRGFTVNLPNGKPFALNGTLVLILDERFDTVNGKRSRSLQFRPIPWEFPEEAYPASWWAVEEYFCAVVK